MIKSTRKVNDIYMVKVKICANKCIEDAKICVEAGTDIIGVLVGKKHKSDDFIDKYTAKK